MPHTLWDRVAELFHAVVDLEPEEREARIAAVEDRALRGEVRALIRAALRSAEGGFIADAVAAAAADLSAGTSRAGQRVGPYRLIRELGRGGMGAVYLARREDAAYESTVAIKFISGALANPNAVRRFRAERQILANLVHPNIARLLDGGTAEDGSPYLVMESVDGEPINTYCAKRALSSRSRVRLMLRVCEAVQAAHAALVVHRDLKPANILVTAEGVPKLVDFGIAKLIESDEEPGSVPTTAVRLTLAYASPEQIRGRGVTVATDVFSLGVVLYELLAGRLPVVPEATGSHLDLERRISEEDPPPPSTVAGDRDVRRELQGDLDVIVGMALRKEPAERYGSVTELADDLRRFLDTQPVIARRPTMGYRMGKFVRRHRTGVGGAAAGLALVVGLTAFYVTRLTHERDVAEAERRKSEQVAGFLEGLFRVADPSEARGASITAREVVDSAVARLPVDLAGQPDVHAAMLYTLGGVYEGLGLGRDAEPLLEQGLALRLRAGGGGSPSIGDFLHRLGSVVRDLGRFDSAVTLLAEAARLLDAEYPSENPSVFARLDLANAHRRAGRMAEADAAIAAAVADARRLSPDSVLETVLSTQAALYLSQRRAAEAEAAAREAWARARDRLGADAPSTISALSNLGQALYQQTRHAEAEPIMREVLALRQRVAGEQHPNTATAWNNLAALLQAQGRHDAAAEAGRRALDIWRASYGERHQRVTLAMTNLASMLLAGGHPEEAERLHRDALRIKLGMLAPGHIDIAVSYNNLGHVLERTERYREAESAYRAALDVMEAGQGLENDVGSIFLANLGRVLERSGRVGDAERTLRRALAIQRDVLPQEHARTATTLTLLGGLLLRADRAAEADTLLREALSMRTALLGADHWEVQVTQSVLGECAAALGRFGEAEKLLTLSADALMAHFGSADDRARTALHRAATFFQSRGDTPRADRYRALLEPAPPR